MLAAIPETLRDWYQSEGGQWMLREMAREFGGPQAPGLHQRVRNALAEPLSGVQAFTRAMAEQGGDLVFGTDTPSGPIFTQFPGINGREEMDRWIEQGISPRQLFLSMTRRNAELLGLADEIGSIAEGRRADLLLMRTNPLISVEAYDTIEWVVVKGVPVEREALRAN